MLHQKKQGKTSAGLQASHKRWEQRKQLAEARWNDLQEWLRIHGRRAAHRMHNIVAGNRAAGPISFLAGSAALAVALTITTLYSPSYAITVDGEPVGAVADAEMVSQAIQNVEQAGTDILGYDYRIDSSIQYDFALTLRSDLTSEEELQTYFYDQLDTVSEKLRKYEVSVDGTPVGVVKDRDGLDDLLTDMQAMYTTENTVSTRFLGTLDVEPIYLADDIMTINEMEQALRSNRGGSTTYTVSQGDTFNGIAFANNMSVSDLKALNPNVDINRLMVGDVLNVKALEPILAVETVDRVTYTQPIACPVETRDDPNMYKGDSKIISQGVEGQEQINATVTYINGQENARQINSSTTLQAPTATIKAVGTKEKPKTASSGVLRWPIRGRITSYFGGRSLFGRYNYHSGLDIAASYGAPICAADGGTVTFAGSKGSYGRLVIITHDNGMQTYYAHNSSLLVSAGQKVYKGQQIAKAGSTGRSTGVHCHFEVRVGGTSVNPLSYLP